MSEQSMPKVFVIGSPISHSKSPLIHNHWIKQKQLLGIYEKIEVLPQNLKSFIRDFAQEGFIGGNVTIPHKEAVLEHVDVIHPTAQRLSAANTLWLEEGKIHADNTDGYGFLANLDQNSPGWDQGSLSKKALILGAGGASRPIIDGLLDRGFDITITNRTAARTESLVDLFHTLGRGERVQMAQWQDRQVHLGDASLLVNTTSLGMTNQPPLEMDLKDLSASCLVTDIVYNPLKTELLLQAEQRGNPTVDGLGMLLHQAVPGFEKWFGTRPVVDNILREIILAA
ncbi:MAG: shikimate dehydrogenase [Cohaesibacter sp.]|jgi:shikimate dehydrogenase|nr:shikimate dehydrogenase [Cohaesibacter sp.]